MRWEVTRLGETSSLIRGVTYKKAEASGVPLPETVPLVRATNIGANLDLTNGLVHVPTSRVSQSQFLRRGDVVLASSSGSLSVVGKSAILRSDWVGTFGAFCAVIRPEQIDASFLAHYVSSEEVRRRWSAAAKGTNINNLKLGDISGTPVPLPPIHEQRRIVEILEDHLSRLDAAADYASAAERRLGSLRRASLERMFGPTGPPIALSQLVSRIEAGKSLGGAAAPAEEGEWGIIKVSAMTWGTFKPDQNKGIPSEHAIPAYEIHPGDLLVSRANTSDYVGASVLVGDNVRSQLLLSDKSLRLVPAPGVNPLWLWRTLQTPSVRAQISALATGTKDSMRNISQKSLLQVRVAEVDADMQDAAVKRFTAAEREWARLELEIDRTQKRTVSLRRSVLTAAFSGRLTGGRTDDEVVEEAAEALD